MSWASQGVCGVCRGTGRAAERRHFVYIVFDAQDGCLYVGRTGYSGEYGDRWQQHKRTNPHMVAEAVRFRLMGPYTRDVADRIELEHQVIRQPKYGEIRATLKAQAVAKRFGLSVIDGGATA